MPCITISLLRGKPQPYLQALADNVHAALVECFEVPADDRFQRIEQFEAHELIFDRHYLAGPRSEDYVLINITAGRPRTSATKQAFYARLAERLQLQPGIRPQDVMVVITTNQAEDWSFGNGVAQVIKGSH